MWEFNARAAKVFAKVAEEIPFAILCEFLRVLRVENLPATPHNLTNI